MNIEERLTELESSVNTILEKMSLMAQFENLIIKSLDSFNKTNELIIEERTRLAALIDMQIQNNESIKRGLQSAIEDSLSSLTTNQVVVSFVRKIKREFNLEDD